MCVSLSIVVGHLNTSTPISLHAFNLVGGRGDAYCGVLNASYNLALRNIKAYIPEYPVGTATEVADMIKEFIPFLCSLNAA